MTCVRRVWRVSVTVLCGLVATACGETARNRPDASGIDSEARGGSLPYEVVRYGPEPSQFAQWWLPRGALAPAAGNRLRVVVLVHGGFWRTGYGLDLMAPLAADLVSRGFAVWNIEYRRVGEPGGGYPGTFDDVSAAFDALTGPISALEVSPDDADASVVGHSAGGHLALWVAGRRGRDGSDTGLRLRRAIGLGAVVDLIAADNAGLGGGAVRELLGGTAAAVPQRYADAAPVAADGVRSVSIRGKGDGIVPARFTAVADQAMVSVDVPGDHFDLIDPSSAAWSAVIAELTCDS